MEDGSVRGFKTATASVQGHLGVAIAAIDLAFGDGYAKANPSLVAAYTSLAIALHFSEIVIVLFPFQT